MSRCLAVLFTVLMITTAGCNGILGDDRSSDPEIEASASPSLTSTASPSESVSNTEEIVLSLSEVGFGYNFTAESVQYANNVSGDTKQQFENRGIRKQHTRVFTLSGENTANNAELIRSTAVRYRSSEDAEADLQNALDTLNNQGGTVSQISIASGVTAHQVQIEADRGQQVVILYGREGSMLYYVVVTDSGQYHEGTARELFIQMESRRS